MGSLQVGAPGDIVATDYLGPLPVTDRGNRYILLFTDHFTKNVEIIPVHDMTAEVCATKLLNEVIPGLGCPLAILVIKVGLMRGKYLRNCAAC